MALHLQRPKYLGHEANSTSRLSQLKCKYILFSQFQLSVQTKTVFLFPKTEYTPELVSFAEFMFILSDDITVIKY